MLCSPEVLKAENEKGLFHTTVGLLFKTHYAMFCFTFLLNSFFMMIYGWDNLQMLHVRQMEQCRSYGKSPPGYISGYALLFGGARLEPNHGRRYTYYVLPLETKNKACFWILEPKELGHNLILKQ